MIGPAALEALAKTLSAPIVDGSPGADVTALAPGITLEDAQRLQLIIKRLQLGPTDQLIGYGAAFTSAGSQKLMPTMPVPLVGAVYSSHRVDDDTVFELGGRNFLAEAEIGIELKSDLTGADVTDAAALAAIAGFFPALELARVIPGSLDGQCSNAQMIALQKGEGGIVIMGDTLHDPSSFDPVAEGVSISVDGVSRAKSTGAAAMGNPVTVLAAMARRLAPIGQGLKAGQRIITGSLTPPQQILDLERLVEVRFDSLGVLSLRLAP